MRFAWLVALLVAAGCGDSDAPGGEPDAARSDGGVVVDSGPRVDAGPDAAVGTLTGSFINRYRTATGVVMEPTFLGQTIAVRGADGIARTGIVGTDGRFSVSGVPPGEVLVSYLRFDAAAMDSLYGVYTSARDLDLGADLGGWRGGAQAAANTALAFDVSGMVTWTGGHTLRVVLPNALTPLVTLAAGTPTGISNFPVDGATALSALTVPWRRQLLEPARGDSLQLWQRETKAGVGTTVLTTISRVYDAAAVTLTDGATRQLSGAFVTPPAASLAMRITRAQWDTLRQAGSAQVQASVRVLAGSAAPVEIALLQVPTDQAMVDTTLAFTDPFGGARTLVVSVGARITMMAPGASTTVFPTLAITATHDAAALPPVLAPLLGPPSGLRLNGMDTSGPLVGVGTGPRLSWNAPTLGTARHYTVHVIELRNVGGATNVDHIVAELHTDATAVQLPANLLSAGRTYFATVTADDFRRRDSPERAAPSLPTASAMAATGEFTP